MKKIIPSLIVLGAIGLGAVVLTQRSEKSKLGATEIAPLETLAFLHLPDLRRSSERWQETALARIGREPEVQAFLERPRTKAAEIATLERVLAQLGRVRPGEAFLATTSLDDSVPKLLGGFSFSGSRADLDALLAEPRAAIHKSWPGGKADRINHAGAQIALYRANDFLFCEAIHRGWYLAATQLELLQAAIDRLDGKNEASRTLASAEQFQASRAALPEECELALYADINTLAYRIVPALAAAGMTMSPAQMAALKRAKAFAFGLKMEGAQFRETAFLLGTGGATPAPLSLSALGLSSAATSFFYAGTTPAEGSPELASPLWSLLPGVGNFQKAAAAAGMKPGEVGGVFGHEFGVLLDWPTDAAAPSVAVALELRDAPRAKKLADALAAESGGPAPWTRTEHRGAILLSQPGSGLLLTVQPTIAIAEKFVVFGFSPDGVTGFLDRGAGAAGRLDAVPEFQRAAKLLTVPTSGFAYLDLANIVQRTYGTFRPLLAMTIALQPGGNASIDAGKLPSATAIARHLTPLVFSSGETEKGVRLESVGPISVTQLAVALGGTAFSGSASWLGQLVPGAPAAPGSTPGSPHIPGVKPDVPPRSHPPSEAPGSAPQTGDGVEKGAPATRSEAPSSR